MEMLVNQTGLTDRKVSKYLVKMHQAITLQAQAMTAQAEQQGVTRENPPSSTMTHRLKDITRVNPLIYIGSNIDEDLKEECREFMPHYSMELLRLTIHAQQVEERNKRKHTRAGTR